MTNDKKEVTGILTLSPCKIFTTDSISNGGAHHKYTIESEHDELMCLHSYINFQNGVEPENGVNGCTMEDLIAVCIHRLECFQMGNYPCRENAIAKTKLEEALMWLNKRTFDRKYRGVEGQNKV